MQIANWSEDLEQLRRYINIGGFKSEHFDDQLKSSYTIGFTIEDVENALRFIGRVSDSENKMPAKEITAEVLNGIVTIPEDGLYHISNQGVIKDRK